MPNGPRNLCSKNQVNGMINHMKYIHMDFLVSNDQRVATLSKSFLSVIGKICLEFYNERTALTCPNS